jgi:hypothetical protein
MALDTWTATEQKIVDPSWRYDFGRLYELACPADAAIGRSIMFGSRPPENDSLWQQARSRGFEVEVFDRNAANREKRVDTSLSVMMTEDSFRYMASGRGDSAVLIAGDGDYIPAINSLAERGFPTRVVFWSHATSRDVRDRADPFVSLDPDLDWLAGEVISPGTGLASVVSTADR